MSRRALGDEEYVALRRPLGAGRGGGRSPAAPVALILRSRTEQLRFLQRDPHRALAVTAVLAVLLATLLSFAVARTITQPLAAITGVMREVAATGDLTRKIALRRGDRWDDEDARLLATTFNTLTDSIARFQREVAQKERLSSLGRLSTVIAHEVRNPLMIIKAALHTLRRRPTCSREDVREAVADIDDEVARLNRIVNEVLDFARPIRFELAPADLNALCRESARRSAAPRPGAAMRVRPRSRAARRSTTDAERLRIALVNILTNARHAVAARQTWRTPTGAADIELETQTGWRSRCRASSSRDRGVGIDARRSCHASSIRTSRPSAAAPGSACRSRRTSSKAWAASIVRRAAGPATAPRSASTSPSHVAAERVSRRHGCDRAWHAILSGRRRGKDPQALGRALRDDGHEVRRDRRAPRGAAAAGRAQRSTS